MMRKYWMFAKSQMQISTTYSAWYWAGSFSIILRLLIMYYFWNAVYENRGTIENMNLSMMLTYIVVAMLLQTYIGGVGNDLAEQIKNGNIAVDLMRPYDLIFKLLSLDFGGKITSFVRETFPMLLIAIFFIKIATPHSISTLFLFVVSGLLGIGIGAMFDLIIGVLAFWTVNVWGLRVLKEGIITFFSGALIPISLFPDWLETLSNYMPFQSMIFVPVSIYSGMISGFDAYLAIVIQLVWLVGLYVIIRLAWAQAIKKVTVFGG